MCIFPSSYHPPSPSHHYVFPGLLRKLLTGPSTSHLELCQSITQPKARVIVFQQEIWSCLQHSFPSPASVCSQDKDSSSHRDQSCCVMPVSWFHPPPYCLPLSPPPRSAPSPPGPLHIFYWEILHLHVHPSASFRTALSQHFRREAPPRTHSGLGYLVGHMFSGPTVPVEPVPCCVTPWSLQLLPSFCLCHQLRVSLRNVFAHSGPSRV